MIATSDFNLKIQDLCEAAGVSQKDIVTHSGYRKSSVSLVFKGERNEAALSVLTVLQSVFELTGNQDILLTGRKPVAVIEPANITPSRAKIQNLVAIAKNSGEVLAAAAEIFADGVVNEGDGPAVKNLEQAVDAAVKTLIETKLSIANAYKNTS